MNIINEIKKYNQYKKDILYKLLVDKIKLEYLNANIDICEWLHILFLIIFI